MKLKFIIIMVLLLSGCQMFIVPFEFNSSIKQITVSERSYIIDENNVLFGLGIDYGDGPVKIMNDVVQVIADSSHTVALKTDGTLWEWGSYRTFTSPLFNQNDVKVLVLEDVKNIWGNDSGLTYILKNDDSLWINGINSYEYCRVSPFNPNESNASRKVNHVLDDVEALYVAPYTSNAIAKTKDGRFFIWGSRNETSVKYDIINEFMIDQTQKCIRTPLEISFDMNVKDLAYAHGTIYLIDHNNSLYGLGNNEYNRINDSEQKFISVPYKIMDNVIEVQSNSFSTFILTQDKSLWGLSNRSGKLGLGHDNIPKSPVKLLDDVSMFSSYTFTNMVLKNNGEIIAWGSNNFNQMGISQGMGHYKPKKVGQVRP
ncbi:MAG: hypothetical protein KGZ51_06370 [Erysipelothrix sp.]|nr:hypothetical protein [Erysipelothrix sp.]